MVFSSLIFLFSFLPIVLLLYYVWLNRDWQNLVLLTASLYFYAWGEKEKVFVMIGSILLNYLIGKWIENNQQLNKKKLYLTIGIVVNLGVLVYFKYSKFFIDILNQILELVGFPIIEGIRFEKLPIGISFYTFQSISYLIDVYRKEVKAQKNIINLGLYIALFPQLIAGPIVRYSSISNQLKNRLGTLHDFNEGVKRFIIGLGKKMLIANPIALFVDEVLFLPPDELSFSLTWIAIIGYSLQIFFDFSGYSDMAIGLGRMFGFKFPENFNFPYISRSIKEFWTRWHISLSVWFRDYLYIPLGGNRSGELLTIRNLIIVFFITGLWHGASWSFIVWGLFHGAFMLLERLGWSKILNKLPKVISNLYTLLVVVFAWVFFRMENIEDAFTLQKTMLGIGNNQPTYVLEVFVNNYFWFVFSLGILFSIPIKLDFVTARLRNNAWLMNTFLFVILVLSISELANNTYNPFIYFRF
jgi:alginate O-acetyltransferase complex protein AlgI